MVGYPRTPNLSHSGLPAAVQSTSAMTTLGESLNSVPRASQSGFIFLQWPHQGARNLMKAALPLCVTSLSKLSGVSSTAVADADAAKAQMRSLRAIPRRAKGDV